LKKEGKVAEEIRDFAWEPD